MTRARFVRSFKYAIEGVVQTFREGRNFKVQLCFAVAAIILGVIFPIEPYEWAIIFVCIGVVLGGECVNTSIESIVDLVSPEYHELAKRAKDIAAGAVLSLSIISVIAGLAIYIDAFMRLIGR